MGDKGPVAVQLRLSVIHTLGTPVLIANVVQSVLFSAVLNSKSVILGLDPGIQNILKKHGFPLKNCGNDNKRKGFAGLLRIIS